MIPGFPSGKRTVKEHPQASSEIKRLSKKYKHAASEIADAISQIARKPGIGNQCPGPRIPVWKLRVKSKDIGGGKSDGFRIVYAWDKEDDRIIVLSRYAKPERKNILAKEIDRLAAIDPESLSDAGADIEQEPSPS